MDKSEEMATSGQAAEVTYEVRNEKGELVQTGKVGELKRKQE